MVEDKSGHKMTSNAFDIYTDRVVQSKQTCITETVKSSGNV
jgi:hypothetical protein